MGAGHASTSVSYAVGLKEAMRRGVGDDGKVVAVIGDGALTGGVAFEALHNAGGMDLPIVIVLNDNGMSIAPNVGALSRHFNRIRLNPKLYHAREDVEETLTRLPIGIGKRDQAARADPEGVAQGLLGAGALLRGARPRLRGRHRRARRRRCAQAVGDALDADRPVVVHCKTVKGKGFEPAEEGGLEGMEKWHGEAELDRGRRVARRLSRRRTRRRRRRSTRPCSATRSLRSAAATSASSASRRR